MLTVSFLFCFLAFLNFFILKLKLKLKTVDIVLLRHPSHGFSIVSSLCVSVPFYIQIHLNSDVNVTQ